jgi:YfiH family protein
VYLTAKNLELAGAVHCFTTRRGGVSTGGLSSLNLGLNRGDSKENVLENYERVCRVLGTTPDRTVFSRQVHGTAVRKAEEKDAGFGLFRNAPWEADGYVTATVGLCLTVFTADCVPILLYDPVKKAAGAVHAGWRGTAGGIAENAVLRLAEEFGSRPGDILAAIGPSVGFCCFETGEDVPEAMLEGYGDAALEYIRPHGDKKRVDLTGLNRLSLVRAGLIPSNIEVSGECTVCGGGLYWSHRRDGASRGSQAAMIIL